MVFEKTISKANIFVGGLESGKTTVALNIPLWADVLALSFFVGAWRTIAGTAKEIFWECVLCRRFFLTRNAARAVDFASVFAQKR